MKNRLRLRTITTMTLIMTSGLCMTTGAFAASHGRILRESKVDVSALTQRAYEGNANAQYALASLYEQGGSGVKKDLSFALSWYEEAAHNGLRIAAEKLKNLSSTP